MKTSTSASSPRLPNRLRLALEFDGILALGEGLSPVHDRCPHPLHSMTRNQEKWYQNTRTLLVSTKPNPDESQPWETLQLRERALNELKHGHRFDRVFLSLSAALLVGGVLGIRTEVFLLGAATLLVLAITLFLGLRYHFEVRSLFQDEETLRTVLKHLYNESALTAEEYWEVLEARNR